jgi:hypothetical protein
VKFAMPDDVSIGPCPCPLCGKGAYKTVGGLRQHLRAAHPRLNDRDRADVLDRLRRPGERVAHLSISMSASEAQVLRNGVHYLISEELVPPGDREVLSLVSSALRTALAKGTGDVNEERESNF